MVLKPFIVVVAVFAALTPVKAQSQKTDSAEVASTLKTLLAICKNVDFGDPKTTKLGTFYKAAPYIIYRGKDKKRAWKTFADYSIAEDKKGVDGACLQINESVNRDSTYKIEKYLTEKLLQQDSYKQPYVNLL